MPPPVRRPRSGTRRRGGLLPKARTKGKPSLPVWKEVPVAGLHPLADHEGGQGGLAQPLESRRGWVFPSFAHAWSATYHIPNLTDPPRRLEHHGSKLCNILSPRDLCRVETNGLEPSTPAVQRQCSPS